MADPSPLDLGIAALAALAGAGSCFAAFGAVAVAVFGWQASRRNNEIAAAVGQIERDRWHRELTPQLACQAAKLEHTDGLVTLVVTLGGPVGLDSLDSVEVRIRDTMTDHTPLPGSDVTERELRDTIWGPLRFRPGVDGADERGRAVPGRPLQTGESLNFILEPSQIPGWIREPHVWPLTYGKPYERVLRLAVTCTKQGYRPWYFPIVVEF